MLCERKFTNIKHGISMMKRKQKLDDNLNSLIKDLYAGGSSAETIAKQMGCSGATISRRLDRLGVIMRKDDYKRHPINQSYFKEIDSADKAYWLGLIATDGNVFENRICINLIDKEHLEKFARHLGAPNFNIKTHQKKSKGKTYLIYRIQFRSDEMVSDLKKYNITAKKSFTVTPWTGPEHLAWHYWRGCVDGDGFISKATPEDRNISMGYCGNLEMVTGFKDFIKSTLNISANIHPNRNIYVVNYHGANAYAVQKKLYESVDPEIVLKRKYDRAISNLEIKKQAMGKRAERRIFTCQICDKPIRSGYYGGLICLKCNNGLKIFSYDAELMKKAINIIKPQTPVGLDLKHDEQPPVRGQPPGSPLLSQELVSD